MRDGSDAIADWPDPERAAQHVVGRDVGVGPSRRRRRHRLFAARRHGRRRRRHARSGREAAARAHLRSRAAASCGTPTPAIRTRLPPRGSSGIDMPMLARGIGAMMIPERPSLERRVLAALDGSAGGGAAHPGRARRLRHRPHVAAAAAARPDRPHARRSTWTSSGSRRRRSASSGAARVVAVSARTVRHGARPEPGARDAFDAALAFLDTARAPGGDAGDVPARRVPRAAHVRELPGPAHACCAICSARSRRAATASC